MLTEVVYTLVLVALGLYVLQAQESEALQQEQGLQFNVTAQTEFTQEQYDSAVEALKFLNEAIAEEPEFGGDSYEGMTIRELKAIASKRKVKGYGDMTKAQLKDALYALVLA